MALINEKYLMDYEKHPVTGHVGDFLQRMSILTMIPDVIISYSFKCAEDPDKKAQDKLICSLSLLRFTNVLLVSGGLAAGLTMLYKASKINLATTISTSIAFPLLWIGSAIAGMFAFGSCKERDHEDRLRDVTYCNPIFAFTVLPVTMLIDTTVNAVKGCCQGKE